MRILWTPIFLIALAMSACAGTEPQLTCTGDQDCFEGYACDRQTQACLKACQGAAQCIGGQFCDSTAGVCRDGLQPGGDPNGGDPASGDPATGDPVSGDAQSGDPN